MWRYVRDCGGSRVAVSEEKRDCVRWSVVLVRLFDVGFGVWRRCEGLGMLALGGWLSVGSDSCAMIEIDAESAHTVECVEEGGVVLCVGEVHGEGEIFSEVFVFQNSERKETKVQT